MFGKFLNNSNQFCSFKEQKQETLFCLPSFSQHLSVQGTLYLLDTYLINNTMNIVHERTIKIYDRVNIKLNKLKQGQEKDTGIVYI